MAFEQLPVLAARILATAIGVVHEPGRRSALGQARISARMRSFARARLTSSAALPYFRFHA